MKHLGDITKINGAEIEAVDVITGGSPCQDLSIAGKRAGLAGARSGLFMEQVRIVKEMREHDRKNGRTGDMVRPRFMVWENVPGAFSSNEGRDFAAVLEEIIRIAEPEAPDIEVPEKRWNTWGGATTMKWEDDGAWLGECMTRNTGESPNAAVVSRLSQILEETPQGKYYLSAKACQGILRRAERRGKDLPERLKAVLIQQSQGASPQEQTEAPAQTEAPTSYAVRIRGGRDGGGKGALVQEDKSGTLGTGNDQTLFCMATQQGGAEIRIDDRAPTLTASAGMSGNNQPVVCAGFKLGNSEQARSIGYAEEQAPTLNAECGGNKPAVIALDMSHACDVIRDCGEVVPSLQARMGTGGNQVPLTYQMQGFGDYREGDVASSCKQRDFKDGTDLVCAVDCRNFREDGETNGTLQYKSNGGTSYNLQNTVRTGMIVRRFTPMECERLQGFPDHWTDIGEWRDSKGKLRKPSDSPRYKALGNSIALPFWDFLAKRISAQYLRPVTMGSLFDGIGGFPLVFERHNGKGTARWASEIEEFPIAVTKLRFGEDA